MTSHYDTYDYPSYWIGREYEHESEVLAIKALLSKIPRISTLLEIGAGYGRLTSTYIHRAKRVILSDPSNKHLASARKKFQFSKVTFVQTPVERLPDKLKTGTVDLVVLVRVLHHVKDVDVVFEVIKKILKKDGYLILEFPNKRHLKAVIVEFLRGNLTYFFDIFPKDLSSIKSQREQTLPFKNYHPDKIKYLLKNKGFNIIEARSVSNIRSVLFKKILPKDVLLFIEKHLQRFLSYINFGPSIFILAQKK